VELQHDYAEFRAKRILIKTLRSLITATLGRKDSAYETLCMSEGIYKALCDSTISSFLNFVAKRYKAAPVRISAKIDIPQSEKCLQCGSDMMRRHKTSANAIDKYVRVLWACSKCDKAEWKTYGTPPNRQRRTQWH
jgi:ribosomal protein S27AE